MNSAPTVVRGLCVWHTETLCLGGVGERRLFSAPHLREARDVGCGVAAADEQRRSGARKVLLHTHKSRVPAQNEPVLLEPAPPSGSTAASTSTLLSGRTENAQAREGGYDRVQGMLQRNAR